MLELLTDLMVLYGNHCRCEFLRATATTYPEDSARWHFSGSAFGALSQCALGDLPQHSPRVATAESGFSVERDPQQALCLLRAVPPACCVFNHSTDPLSNSSISKWYIQGCPSSP